MPDPNPSERLAEIEARVEAATEGPWRWAVRVIPPKPPQGSPKGRQVIREPSGSWIAEAPGDEYGLRDAMFIAEARSDILWLLGELEAAKRGADSSFERECEFLRRENEELLEREKTLREALDEAKTTIRRAQMRYEHPLVEHQAICDCVSCEGIRAIDAALADSGEASGEAG